MINSHIRKLVELILASPEQFDWSAQGLGMLRVYLDNETRLHIWDSSLKVPGVSPLHSHPWDLESLVVAGRYKQHRYIPYNPSNSYMIPEEFNSVTIQCGSNACTTSETEQVVLHQQVLETYFPGNSYKQTKDEIHMSCPEDGTVTLVDRTFYPDRDHAQVLWRGKGGWVDAKPRRATEVEILDVTRRALETWF